MSLNIQEKDPETGELKRKVVAGNSNNSSVIFDSLDEYNAYIAEHGKFPKGTQINIKEGSNNDSVINDSIVSQQKTWSSEKISGELDNIVNPNVKHVANLTTNNKSSDYSSFTLDKSIHKYKKLCLMSDLTYDSANGNYRGQYTFDTSLMPYGKGRACGSMYLGSDNYYKIQVEFKNDDCTQFEVTVYKEGSATIASCVVYVYLI